MKTKRTFTLTAEARCVLDTAATLLDAIAESGEPFVSLDWCNFTTDEIQCAASLLTSLANS